MKKCIVMLGLVLLGGSVWGQSLGKERIERLKESVVRILVNDTAAGTGFIVSLKGWIATNLHVVKSSIGTVNGRNQLVKKLEVQLANGEKVPASISDHTLGNGYLHAFSYDCALIKPTTPFKSKTSALKIGTFANVAEGDEIYSCGHPLGIKPQFISKGMISTFWKDTLNVLRDGKPFRTVLRDVCYLDMTLNRGNSGGPVIKIMDINDPSKDVVVGIATFILNPYGVPSEQLLQIYNQQTNNFSFQVNGVDQNLGTRIALSAIANNSIGVSGMISIDYLRSLSSPFDFMK